MALLADVQEHVVHDGIHLHAPHGRGFQRVESLLPAPEGAHGGRQERRGGTTSPGSVDQQGVTPLERRSAGGAAGGVGCGGHLAIFPS